MKNNPMICDPKTGVCEIAEIESTEKNIDKSGLTEKPIKLLYFTDPICSACWAIEGQLKRLKLEYGDMFDIEYCMGGLLPGWDGFNGGGIASPADVAHHWNEMSDHFAVPIDGDVWNEDPLDSSYPPSIAFKAAFIQNPDKALLFLRTLREMLFLEKKNICKWENIAAAAQCADLDIDRLKIDYHSDKAKQLFEENLNLTRQWGVRGFPSVIFLNSDSQRLVVYGSQHYAAYEDALIELCPGAVKQPYDSDARSLLKRFGNLMAMELSVLGNISVIEANNSLTKLTQEGFATEYKSRKGSIWSLK